MKKRSSRWLIWAGVIGFIAVLILGSIFWTLGVPNGLKLSGLLQQTLDQESFDGDLILSTGIPEDTLDIQTQIFRRTSDNLTVHGITLNGIPICFANHRVIFDNGRAFDVGDLLPQEMPDINGMLKMLPFAGVTKEMQGEDTIYALELNASKLQMLSPDFPAGSSLEAKFAEHAGALSEMDLCFSDGTRQTDITLCFVPDRQREIPQEVWHAVNATDSQPLAVLAPLANALIDFSRANPLGARLEVTADCGPIALTDTMMLYGIDSDLYLQRGELVTELDALDFSDHTLLALGYKFCRDGRFSRVDSSGSYSLTIPAESVKDFCVEVLPEIEMLPIHYEDASLLLEVKDNTLSDMKMDVSGQMPFLLTTIEISLGASLHPIPPESVILPEDLT